jgi:GDP-L-fucose synthase
MSKKRIFIAGDRGMVGSAIGRKLSSNDTLEIITRNRQDLDLLNQSTVAQFFQSEKIDEVYLAAAKVGGIQANNTYPAQFIYENLMIEANIIHSAYENEVKKLLFLGSSCIYPKLAPQPMAENVLLTDPLEPTNEPYAIAKIAGIKLCESYNRQYHTDFRSVMPTNLYGPQDNFDAVNSHVLPGLLRRFHEAKLNQAPIVTVWGTGTPKREFLHVDDMADACIHVMGLTPEQYQSHTEPMLSHLNVGTGTDHSIQELALLIAKTVDYKGEIQFDHSKPDGAPRKLLNVNRLAKLGWTAQITLEEGLKSTYQWFLTNESRLRI